MTRVSLIATHHSWATVAWFDLSFVPMVQRMGFKPAVADVLVMAAERSITRWSSPEAKIIIKPVVGPEKIRQPGFSESHRRALGDMYEACRKGGVENA